MFKGNYYDIQVTGKDFRIRVHHPEFVEPGSNVGVDIEPDAIHVMENNTSKASQLQGEIVNEEVF